MKKPVALIVLDGWGLGKEYEGNAVKLAETKNFDRFMKRYPHTKLTASGLSVGLPEGQMGNSEVGHLNIGAGRIVYQELTRINKAIADGEFQKKEEFIAAINSAKKNGKSLHLMGLVSHGGVHSHIDHLYGLLETAKEQGIKDVYVHCFLDGRDVSPNAGKGDIIELENKMKELNIGQIATISGRYYAMDRDTRWNRTKLAYDAITMGIGRESDSSEKAVLDSYAENITDEFIVPTVIKKDGSPIATVEDGDSIIFFNFRPDRARQLTRFFVDEEFDYIERTKKVNTYFVTMTQYDKTIKNVVIAYKPQKYKNTLGEYLSKNGLNQLRIAETEKYAHVTFFFNGGVETPNPGEDRALIPSPKVATYDLKPEMSAIEVKNELIDRINKDKYDFIVLNFANSDMVGHTGVIDSAVKAVETVDRCLGEVIDEILKFDGKAIITADHGNSEEMLDEKTGSVITAHTTNPVPCILVGEDNITLREGILADLAPTILDIMGLGIPREMTGKSLIIK
ncbi:2,3-bisphosphoglycerate-independent phosphoglycerate mutase [Clostridiisalibacter paucivorans]|uniref:2,3-bisphosphoglycerate-independent phosphoglycerate mutase n=1 Tax=Clostridiisalibacter paucivorans TaxID=408753 RepID=UPI00047E4125|nr:2,3-bisphosphoglycerate-independent phosphoglycerate mutase [Clostridiisalibacter paucivorans]